MIQIIKTLTTANTRKSGSKAKPQIGKGATNIQGWRWQLILKNQSFWSRQRQGFCVLAKADRHVDTKMKWGKVSAHIELLLMSKGS